MDIDELISFYAKKGDITMVQLLHYIMKRIMEDEAIPE